MKDSIERQRNHFDSVAKEYNDKRNTSNHLLYKELFWDFFFSKSELSRPNPPVHVLEAMCGYAEGKDIIEKYYGKDIDYEGFDYSDVMIGFAKERHPDTKIWVSDVTTFQPQKQYDMILLLSGLHHVPDYTLQVLKAMKKSLKPNGVFINYEPTHNNYLYKKVREHIYNRNSLFDEKTEQDYSLNEINEYYIKAGFQIKKQFYPGLLAYILYGNPDAFPFLGFGGAKLMKLLMKVEMRLYTSVIGKFLSFSTISILE